MTITIVEAEKKSNKKEDVAEEWWSGSAVISVTSSGEVASDINEVVRPLIVKILSEELNIKKLFPIQSAVIPLLLKARTTGQSACVCAATGSGKTLCFVLPILQVLLFPSFLLPPLLILLMMLFAVESVCHRGRSPKCEH